MTITNGVHHDVPEQEYHSHPALSASGAKLLLPPSCPAKFKWQRDHPPAFKDDFDFGHAAHKKVLGVGADIVSIDRDNWMTKYAKEARADAQLAGQIPLLAKDSAIVDAMAQKLKEHRLAMALFQDGQAEASLFWNDGPTGIQRRARLDWLPAPTDRRMVLADYKTAASASPDKFAKSLFDFGYDIQDANYQDAVTALGLAENPGFVFVVQEKTAPFIVSVFEPDANAVRVGRYRNRLAIDLFAECTAAEKAGQPNPWPAYTKGIAPLSLPRWVERQYESIA